jgi:hypothetical protein
VVLKPKKLEKCENCKRAEKNNKYCAMKLSPKNIKWLFIYLFCTCAYISYLKLEEKWLPFFSLTEHWLFSRCIPFMCTLFQVGQLGHLCIQIHVYWNITLKYTKDTLSFKPFSRMETNHSYWKINVYRLFYAHFSS